MPFKSDKQRKWMHANEPDMAKKWEKEEKNEGNIGITTKKGKSIELTHRTSGKEIVVVNTPSVLKKYAKMGYLISMPEGKLNEAKFKDIDVKKLGKKKTNDLMKYLFNIVDLGLKTDMKTDTKKKILSVTLKTTIFFLKYLDREKTVRVDIKTNIFHSKINYCYRNINEEEIIE